MSNTIEQSVRDDDATLCQNTTTTSLVNPTASRISLRTDFSNGGLAADRHSGSARLVRRPVQLLVTGSAVNGVSQLVLGDKLPVGRRLFTTKWTASRNIHTSATILYGRTILLLLRL